MFSPTFPLSFVVSEVVFSSYPGFSTSEVGGTAASRLCVFAHCPCRDEPMAYTGRAGAVPLPVSPGFLFPDTVKGLIVVTDPQETFL